MISLEMLVEYTWRINYGARWGVRGGLGMNSCSTLFAVVCVADEGGNVLPTYGHGF